MAGKKQVERTIPKELHDAWVKLKRRGDPDQMAIDLGYSRPTIDNALTHGYVSFQGLPDEINKWFHTRMVNERKAAEELMDSMAQNAVPSPKKRDRSKTAESN